MKLSTSSNIVFERPDHSIVPMEKMLQLAHASGFNAFDINFYDWSLPNSPFLTDGWRNWIERIAVEKEKLQVEFVQCHAYTYNFLNPRLSEEEHDYQEQLVLRSLECCHIVGSKLCVTHPETCFDSVTGVETSKSGNVEYFKRLFEKITKLDMELAIENMCDTTISPKRKYCACPEEMMDFLQDFEDERMGICWDFEHAAIMQQSQRDALIYIGKQLKATHASDTHSATDPRFMHIMPFFGNVDWQEVILTLKEIGYQGYFNLEANNYCNYLPDELLPTALQLAHEIGIYLINL